MNCSSSPSSNLLIGWVLLLNPLVYLPLYIPCLIAICQQPLIGQTCFKVMACMGVTDITNLVTFGMVTGLLTVTGRRACDHHLFYKLHGAISQGLWMHYCSLTSLLAFSRCMEIVWRERAVVLFGKGRVWLWIGATYIFALTHLFICCSPLATIYWNADVGLFQHLNSQPDVVLGMGLIAETSGNLPTPIICVVSYATILRSIRNRANAVSTTQARQQLNETEQRLLLQSLLVCALTTFNCLGYLTIPFVATDRRLFAALNICVLTGYGFNCIIYLSLNTTIRSKVVRNFRLAGCARRTSRDRSSSSPCRCHRQKPKLSNESQMGALYSRLGSGAGGSDQSVDDSPAALYKLSPSEKSLIMRTWPLMLRANTQLFTVIWLHAVNRSAMIAGVFKLSPGEDPQQNASFVRLTAAVESWFHRLIVVHELDDEQVSTSAYELGQRHVAFAERGFNTIYWDIFMVSLLDALHVAAGLVAKGQKRMRINYVWRKFVHGVIEQMRAGFNSVPAAPLDADNALQAARSPPQQDRLSSLPVTTE